MSVELPPEATAVGLALKLAVGAGATATVVEALAEPPAPWQLREKPVVTLNGAVACDPLRATVPDQPPAAVHEVAFVELQVSVAVPPVAIVLGAALRLTAGAGATVTVVAALCEPPVPEQVSV